MVIFDDSGIKLKVVRDFVHKAHAGSAPSLNGISYKLYKNCPRVLRKLTVLLQQAWKKGIVPQEWCLADGIWIPKEMQSRSCGSLKLLWEPYPYPHNGLFSPLLVLEISLYLSACLC